MNDIQYHKVTTPVVVTEGKLGIPLDFKNKCIQEAYRLGDSMNQTTNVKSIMSTWGVFEQTDVFNPIFDRICEISKTFTPSNCQLDLKTAWSAIYKKGHFTITHNHEPSFLSFVYYLKSTGNTPLVFSDSNFKINPTDDTIVLFPGYVKHEVPTHREDVDRICLAGNFEIALKKELTSTLPQYEQ